MDICWRSFYGCRYCADGRLSGITKTVQEVGVFSLPKLVFLTSHEPIFDLGAFLTIAIVFLVSAAETTGATSAVCTGALDREIKMEELQGSLAVDGFSSALSGCFGCLPLTSFSQNVGLVTMTQVINRFTILMGAFILILSSLSRRWEHFLIPCHRQFLAAVQL